MRLVLKPDGTHDRIRCPCEGCVDWREEMLADARESEEE